MGFSVIKWNSIIQNSSCFFPGRQQRDINQGLAQPEAGKGAGQSPTLRQWLSQGTLPIHTPVSPPGKPLARTNQSQHSLQALRGKQFLPQPSFPHLPHKLPIPADSPSRQAGSSQNPFSFLKCGPEGVFWFQLSLVIPRDFIPAPQISYHMPCG